MLSFRASLKRQMPERGKLVEMAYLKPVQLRMHNLPARCGQAVWQAVETVLLNAAACHSRQAQPVAQEPQHQGLTRKYTNEPTNLSQGTD